MRSEIDFKRDFFVNNGAQPPPTGETGASDSHQRREEEGASKSEARKQARLVMSKRRVRKTGEGRRGSDVAMKGSNRDVETERGGCREMREKGKRDSRWRDGESREGDENEEIKVK